MLPYSVVQAEDQIEALLRESADERRSPQVTTSSRPMKRLFPGAARRPSEPGDGASSASPGSGLLDQLGPQYLTEFAPLLSVGETMQPVKRLIEDVAATDATVLVLGESGVGKDLVARAIHAASLRRNGPFVKVNCAALPSELLETELFGHEKGAFTGAHRRKPGKFEFANQGTICLDEIGEMPRALQAKLLHVLQDLQFSRVGGEDVIRVDLRVVATTNRDLEKAIASGDFREDLYYRLNVVEIRVPPLRERRDTLPTLVTYHLARLNAQYRRQVELTAETIELFAAYTWPGNVRELENLLRRLVVVGHPQQVHEYITRRLHRTPSVTVSEPHSAPAAPEPARNPSSGRDVTLDLRALGRRAAQEAERKALLEVLDRVDWNQAKAARILHVSYKTLRNRLAKFGMGPPGGRRARKDRPPVAPGP